MRRKYPLETERIYHVLSKSIAGYKIFSRKKNYSRMFDTLKYYMFEKPPLRFSRFVRAGKNKKNIFNEKINQFLREDKNKLVEVVAYCLMPTHMHLVLRQVQEEGISIFMNKILNSYTRYFNLLYKRKGPLWEGPFKNILVETDEQLFHLTRYVHLNPVTASIINNPEEWDFSSYKEYLGINKDKVCKYNELFEIQPDSYKQFVESRIIEQRELHKIKKIMLD